MVKITLAGGYYLGLGPFVSWDDAWVCYCDNMAEMFGAYGLNETDSEFAEDALVCYDPEVYS